MDLLTIIPEQVDLSNRVLAKKDLKDAIGFRRAECHGLMTESLARPEAAVVEKLFPGIIHFADQIPRRIRDGRKHTLGGPWLVR